jgi:hypothetical protein
MELGAMSRGEGSEALCNITSGLWSISFQGGLSGQGVRGQLSPEGAGKRTHWDRQGMCVTLSL